MLLKSDKVSSSTFSFSNIVNVILNSTWFYILSVIVLVGLGNIVNDNLIHVNATLGLLGMLVLISAGEIFKNWQDFFLISSILLLIMIPITYMNTPIKTVSDSMNITPLVTDIKIDEDCNCGSKVIVDFDKPFEEHVTIKVEEKYLKLITDKETASDFIFTARKECNTYPSGKLECETFLHLTHQFEENEISNTELKNSIYPKKFDMEKS